MKDKNKILGFAQPALLLVFGALIALAVGLYITKSGFRKSEPAQEQPLTTEQKILSADNDLKVTASFEEELDLSELQEIEKELNEANFSSI